MHEKKIQFLYWHSQNEILEVCHHAAVQVEREETKWCSQIFNTIFKYFFLIGIIFSIFQNPLGLTSQQEILESEC